jgi:hypothetical protein
VLAKFTDENGKALGKAGITASGANLYAAHTLGVDKAKQVLTAADNVPLKQLLGAKTMAANPQWNGMTVAEYKQWTQQKMGGPVSASVAGQNAIRKVDYVYSRTQSLDTLVRRDIYGKTLLDAAQKTLDPSYLDKMPPEYMTPQTQFEFQQARTQIGQAKFAQDQQQRQVAEQQRTDRIRQQKIEINQKAIDGTLNVGDYAGADPEVFQHAAESSRKDLTIDPNAAAASRVTTMSNIQAAAIDPSKWGNVYPQFKDLGRPPTDQELMNAVQADKSLNSTETMAILNGFQKAKDIGNLVNSQESKDNYTATIDTLAKKFTQDAASSIEGKSGKLEGDGGISYDAEARTAYNNAVKLGIQAEVATTGKVPTNMAPILEKATKVAIDHIKLLKEAHAEGAKPNRSQELAGKGPEEVTKALAEEAKPAIVWTKNKAGENVIQGSPDDDATTNPTGVPSTTQHPAPAEPVKTGPQEGDTFTTEKGTKLTYRSGQWQSPIVPAAPVKGPTPSEVKLPPKEQVLRERPSSTELRGPQSGDIRMRNGISEVYKMITIGRSSRYEWVPNK